MWTIALSVLVGAVVGTVVGLVFSTWYYGIVPALFFAVLALFFAGRRVYNGLMADMNDLTKHMTPPTMRPGQKPPSPKELRQHFAKAIEHLESVRKKWRPWVPFLDGQINAQIGQILYVVQDFAGARPFLEGGTPRIGLSWAMLAALQHREKNVEGVKKTMEGAVKHTPKDALLWNLYAWFLVEAKDGDGALRVLQRAMEHVGTDERTKKNLDALQNGKTMRMRAFSEMWYQFHFEAPQMQQMAAYGPQPGRNMRPRMR